ncbi:MAG: hypothetical protein JWS10_4225, partial [Cypionkella sp.]|uniref:sulfotransferase domain-containing protein n=1 Tax=Cypionkella sp. TaxID=2811411 RepID=UPI00262A91C0
FSYVERGLYAQQVRRLLDLFPSQQILFLRSSDLGGDPAGTLTRIAEFLEIGPFAPTLEKRVNIRKYLPYPSQLTVCDIRHLRKIFRPEIDAFATLTGLCVDTWLTCRSG